MLLPAGAELPPLIYTIPLVLAVVGVTALLWAIHPPITDWTVLAFTPWMMTGAVLHVLNAQEAYPASVEPLFGTATVYATTGAVAGLVWIVMTFVGSVRAHFSVDRGVAIVGTGSAAMFIVFSILLGAKQGTLAPLWPVLGAIGAGVVAGLAWILLSLTATDIAAHTGKTGATVVFAHTLDGITTAIGYDVLGATERTPLSRMILETAAKLPTAEYVGAGWLFVLVKILLSLLILAAFKDYVDEAPRQARVLLGLVVAVGLGPGVHNLLLFAVTAGGA